jgi:hypothetical protein
MEELITDAVKIPDTSGVLQGGETRKRKDEQITVSLKTKYFYCFSREMKN